MMIFDQLKKNDPQLRALTMLVLVALGVLVVGLWYVQVVSRRYFQANLETQSYRTVRIPAVRGKIFDRDGLPLADNRASFNVSLYLEELRTSFQKQYSFVKPLYQKQLGRKLTRPEQQELGKITRYSVVSNIAAQLSQLLQTPLAVDEKEFHRHYKTRLALPMIVATNLMATQIARLQEQSGVPAGLDLEVQPVRAYPRQTLAAHVLGHLQRDDSSAVGEEAFFNYWMPDWRGIVGIEGGFDQELRGRAGAKSVLVNHLGYRQSQNVWSAAEAGQNVVLTIDHFIQEAAEKAIQRPFGTDTRGAVVVMEVESGDVLALVSSPTYNPNMFVKRLTHEENQRMLDPKLRPEINRATQTPYQPGSTFKPIVALAALENGLNPAEKYTVASNPKRPGRGIIYIGNISKSDTAPPGEYDLRLALVRSSNSYFIDRGLRRGVFGRVVELGKRLQLGEKVGLNLKQEASGHFPNAEQVRKWPDGDRANICIGQGEMDVTPLQMAVLTAALANGGDVLQPRLVDRLESQDPTSLEPATVFPKHQVRDRLGVSKRNLDIVRDAMLAETEAIGEHATGQAARVAGLRICGKTGTAERTERGETRNTTWFISYAPYEHPKYAVVVAVEDGGSGGATCAPIAQLVYLAIVQREKMANAKPSTSSQEN